MTDQQDKDGVVIDVTPEHEPARRAGAETADQQTAATRRARGWFAPVLLALGVASLLGLVGLGYWHWAGLRAELDALDRRLTENLAVQAELRESAERAQTAVQDQQEVLDAQEARLRATLGDYQAAAREQRQLLAAREHQLAEEQRRLETRELELREAVADVQRRIGRSGAAWMVAEAEYLIRLAGYRLDLAGDALTARAALALADERLRDTLDPAFSGVREVLARELEALAAIDWPDVDALAARLSRLIDRLPKLQPAGDNRAVAATDPVAATAADERNWDTLVDDFLAGMKDAVRIRHNDQPVPALPEPRRRALHQRALELRLEAARLALVLGEAGMYRTNLAAAREALSQHFRTDDPLTRELDAELAALAEIDIRPELPDGTAEALRLLQAAARPAEAATTAAGAGP